MTGVLLSETLATVTSPLSSQIRACRLALLRLVVIGIAALPIACTSKETPDLSEGDGDAGGGGSQGAACEESSPAPEPITVQLVNETDSDFYVTAAPKDGYFDLQDLDGTSHPRLWTCGDRLCSKLDAESTPCPGILQTSSAVKIAAGATYELRWDGKAQAWVQVVDSCWGEASDDTGRCLEREEAPSEWTFSVHAYSDVECSENEICDCETNADGICVVSGATPGDGRPITVSMTVGELRANPRLVLRTAG